MKAIILAVGDELMTGAIVDTNSAWLSGRLMELGIETVRHVTVGDDAAAITAALVEAARAAEVVIATGGLGPTLDDLSREALAEAMGVELWEDRHSLRRIARFFESIGRPMSPSNKVQALVPAGADVLDNDCGTAPGLAGRVGEATVYVLPGPPHEMREMFEKQVRARLAPAGALATRILHTFGQGESAVGEKLGELMDRGREVRVGTTACAGVISVRIIAPGPTDAAAEKAADAAAGEVKKRLGDLVYGEGAQTLPGVTGAALKAAGETLAVAESCTGGMIGSLLTSVPGSSAYFLGGVVPYAYAVKTSLLGVDQQTLASEGAVSEATARQMAEGVRERLAADWGLAVTGIAGPDGGTDEKPVGLVFIALAGRGETKVWQYVFPGQRDFIRTRTALAAMNHLRLSLGEKKETKKQDLPQRHRGHREKHASSKKRRGK